MPPTVAGVGEDLITTLKDDDENRFAKALGRSGLQGIPSVRFHLHPDVDAVADLGGAAVSMALKSGEIWVFRHDGSGELSLEPSVYLENGRLKPRPSKQVVLSGRTNGLCDARALVSVQGAGYAGRDPRPDTFRTTGAG